MTAQRPRRSRAPRVNTKTRQMLIESLESRQMMAEDTARQILRDVPAPAPSVSEVLLGANEFSNRFKNHLAAANLGSADGFVRMTSGPTQPFVWEADSLRIRFSEAVDVRPDDLILTGVRGGRIIPTSFQYDATRHEATWGLPDIARDRLAVNLSNSIQSLSSGKFIDADPSDTQTSTPFFFAMDVMAGDYNRDGFVSNGDLTPIRNNFLATTTSANYNIFHDGNADGFITNGDLTPIRNNFLNTRPNSPAPNQRTALPPGISKLTLPTIAEDATPTPILFAVNSSAGLPAGASNFTFQIVSSNESLSRATNAVVRKVGSYYELGVALEANQSGSASLTVRVQDALTSSLATLPVQVTPVNDAPTVTSEPVTIDLTNLSPASTLNLSNYFQDIDDTSLSYSVTSFDASQVAIELNGSQLRVTSLLPVAADTFIRILATDAGGLSVALIAKVVIDRLPVLPQFQAITSQIIPAGETFSVQVPIENIQLQRLTVASSNGTVLPSDRLSLVQVGSSIVLRLSHSGANYGASYVTIRYNQVPVAGLPVLLLSPASETNGPTDLDLNVALSDLSTSGSEVTRVGVRRLNDRALAWLVSQGKMDSSMAVSLLSPDDRLMMREQSSAFAPKVSQTQTDNSSASRYQIEQFYRPSVQDGTIADIDQQDEYLQVAPNLEAVQAAINARNPAAAIRGYLNGNGLVRSVDMLNAAIREIDVGTEKETFAEVYAHLDGTLATYSRTINRQADATPVQFVLRGTELLARNSVALAAGGDALLRRDPQVTEPIDRARSAAAIPLRQNIEQLLTETGITYQLSAAIDVGRVSGQKLAGRVSSSLLEDIGNQIAREVWDKLRDAGKVVLEKLGTAFETANKLAGHLETAMQIADLVGDIYSLLSGPVYVDQYIFMDGSNHQIVSGEQPDTIRTGSGDDDITANAGDDYIDAGGGNNKVSAGPGNDEIVDGAGNSFLDGGRGQDTLIPAGGSDVLTPGPGNDIIQYGQGDFGTDVLIDSDTQGKIRFQLVASEDVILSKAGVDLRIDVVSTETTGTLIFRDYFVTEMLQWVVETASGLLDLFTLVRGISMQDAFELAIRSYDEAPDYTRSLTKQGRTFLSPSLHNHHVKTYQLGLLGLSAELYFVNGDSKNIAVAVRGSGDFQDWLLANPVAGSTQGLVLFSSLWSDGYLGQATTLSITGHSLGGMVSQWLAFGAAFFPNIRFINIHTFNTVDISGLLHTITDILPGTSLTVSLFQAKINTIHAYEQQDIVSRIGWWAGDGLGSTSYATFHWPEPLPAGSTGLVEVLYHHGPMKRQKSPLDDLTNTQIDTTQFGGSSKQQYDRRLIPTLRGFLFVLASEVSDTDGLKRSVSMYDILGGSNLDATWNTQVESQVNNFVSRVTQATGNLTPTNSFVRKFDFGPVGSLVAPGTIGITPNQRYDGNGNGIRFGWTATSNLLAQDRGKADDLQRDFISTPDGTFVVDTESAGTYNLVLTMGDREMGSDATIREDMRIYVNDAYLDTVSTMPGQILRLGYQVHTNVPQLRVRLLDESGRSSRAVLNGLELELVPSSQSVPSSTEVQNDDSIIVMTHGYTLPKGVGMVLDTIEVTAKAVVHIADITSRLTVAAAKGGKIGVVLEAVKIVLEDIRWVLQQDFTSVRATSPVHDWVFDTADRLAIMSNKFRLGTRDSNIIPIDLSDTYQTLNRDNETVDQVLSHWQGSQDFLVLDWTKESNNGLGLLEAMQLNPAEAVYRQGVESAAYVINGLIKARVAKLKETRPDAKLDILFISHGFGYNVNRQVIEDLAISGVADDLDYVKFQSLDPVSMKPDELLGTASASDKYNWYHPEFNGVVDQVENIYQTEGLFKVQGLADLFGILDEPIKLLGNVVSGALKNSILGSMTLVAQLVSEHAQAIQDTLTFGRALDGREGGGTEGFFNGQTRLFDLASSQEILRFRHWNTDAINADKERLAAEMTAIEFSPDGRLIASAGEDGITTVRYARDQFDPAGSQTIPSIPAGQEAFNVWGQESPVRDLDFFQMQTNSGQWKDYLVSVSSPRVSDANDADYTDATRNRIVITDASNGDSIGRTVWIGKHVGVTQVSVSPTGNWMVSSDRSGNVKLWRRNLETLTAFDLVDTIAAHPAASGTWVLDLVFLNDEYFVTASADKTVRLFRVRDDVMQRVGIPIEFASAVTGLAYDPFNALLAVTSGTELRVYSFQQSLGLLQLELLRSSDHVRTIRDVAFTKPAFAMDSQGNYLGLHALPAAVYRAQGDFDLVKLRAYAATLAGGRNTLDGLQLITGGDDRTVFKWKFSQTDWAIRSLPKDLVVTGAMLPIQNVAVTANAKTLAIIGQNNIRDDQDELVGGPVRDIDATSAIDKRIGFSWTELFVGGVREHADVPYYYAEDIVGVVGEEWFWQRDNDALARWGDLPSHLNLALPPNKRAMQPGIDVLPTTITVRPEASAKVKPLNYLLEIDRDQYKVTHVQGVAWSQIGNLPVFNSVGLEIGRISKVTGQPGVLRFTASGDLDFSQTERYMAELSVAVRSDIKGTISETIVKVQLVVLNYVPVANDDFITVYPTRSGEILVAKNDYDVDGDNFRVKRLPSTPLVFRNTQVGTVVSDADNPGLLRVTATATTQLLEQLIAAERLQNPGAPAYIEATVDYTLAEVRFGGTSQASLRVRIQVQEAPQNLTKTRVGADQFVLSWDPVGWEATRYLIQRWNQAGNSWVTVDQTSENVTQKLVTGLSPTTNYTFRVAANNQNNGRMTFSEPLDVLTPDYEAPQFVVPVLPLHSTYLEVTWDKVYWNAAGYLVKLQQLRLDANNQPVIIDGQMVFDDYRQHVVSADEPARWKFTDLDPGKTFLWSVRAQRMSDNITAPTRYATEPVTTPEREVASSIKAERVGPDRVLVSWNGISWSQGYRVVVMDRLTEQRIEFDKLPADHRQFLATGLQPERVYLTFVETKDKQGHWISILPSEGDGPVVIDAASSGIDLSGGSRRFAIASDRTTDVALPIVDGLIIDVNFDVLNLARVPVRLVATAGQKIFDVDSGTETDSLQLPAAIGSPTALTYNLRRGTRNGWELRRTLDAQLFVTPSFSSRAMEPGSDVVTPTARTITFNWSAPLWSVRTYRLEIFDGQQSKGFFAFDSQRLNNGDVDLNATYQRKFDNLTPGKSYRLVLTARGWDSNKVGIFETPVFTRPYTPAISVGTMETAQKEFTVEWEHIDRSEVASFEVLISKSDNLASAVFAAQRNSAGDYALAKDLGNQRVQFRVTHLRLPGGSYEAITAATKYYIWVRTIYNPQTSLINTDNPTVNVTTLGYEPATGLTATNVTRNSFTMTWTPPAGNTHDKYNMRISNDGGQTWLWAERPSGLDTQDMSKTLTEVTLVKYQLPNGTMRAFQANTTYLVRLTAVYDNNEVFVPTQTSLTTLDYTQATGVTASNPTSSSMQVAWTFNDPGSDVDHFKIEAQRVGTTTWEIAANNIPATQRSSVASDLEFDTQYIFRVQTVYTTGGPSISSPSNAEWTLPYIPVINNVVVNGKRSMTVQWSAFPTAPASLRIEVLELDENMNPVGGWIVPTDGNVAPTVTSKTITELIPGTTYDIRLRATNSRGTFAFSVPVRRTTEAYPVIQGLRAVNHTGTEANAQWVRLENLDSAANVTNNIVSLYKQGQLIANYSTGPGAGNFHFVTLPNLIMGETYTMRVAAYNDGVKLSQSPLVSFRAYTPATGVSVSPIAWQKVSVSWIAPAIWSPAEYFVKLYEVGVNNPVDTRTVTGATLTTNFGNLKTGTLYYAVIVARNSDLAVTGVESSASGAASTYGRTAPVFTQLSQAGAVLTFRWNHFAPPEIGTNLVYRVERLGGDGQWKTVRGAIAPAVGQTAQVLSINRNSSANPINSGSVYDFRIVAVYNAEELNSNIIRQTVQ